MVSLVFVSGVGSGQVKVHIYIYIYVYVHIDVYMAAHLPIHLCLQSMPCYGPSLQVSWLMFFSRLADQRAGNAGGQYEPTGLAFDGLRTNALASSQGGWIRPT